MRSISAALLVLFAVVANPDISLAVPPAEGREDRGLCSSVAGELLPRKSSFEFLSKPLVRSDISYRGHRLSYIDFSFDRSESKYVIVSGYIFQDVGRAFDVTQVDIALASSEYFAERGWRITGGLSDMSRNGQMQLDQNIKLLSSVILYMQYGKLIDDCFLEKCSGSLLNLANWGVRGPRLSDWYQCQSCSDAMPETYSMSQDLRSLRLAKVGANLVVVTTRPRTILAAISPQGRVTYMSCSDRVGRNIDLF